MFIEDIGYEPTIMRH